MEFENDEWIHVHNELARQLELHVTITCTWILTINENSAITENTMIRLQIYDELVVTAEITRDLINQSDLIVKSINSSISRK